MKSDQLSTTDHAEDVLPANGQDKFQTTRELLVSTDHSLNAQTALPEDPMITTLANNAHTDKFKTHKTCKDVSPEPAVELDKSNFQLITKAVESARLANGHNSPQTNPRLNVLLDQWPFATADRDNQPMDTLAKPAQLDKSKAQLTKKHALDQTAQDNIKSNLELIPITVEDVRHANGHNSLQTHQEPSALPDHLLTATVSAEEQDWDTLARNANQVPSKTPPMSTNVFHHIAMALTKSKSHSMLTAAEDVKTANSQDTSQMPRELSAFWDHSPSATALASNLLTDTHARNAHMVRDKIQETHKDVFQLQDVTLETKLLDSETPKTATTAEHAPSHKSQDKIDQNATDQSQLAVALKD